MKCICSSCVCCAFYMHSFALKMLLAAWQTHDRSTSHTRWNTHFWGSVRARLAFFRRFTHLLLAARIQVTFATELAVLVECMCLSCVYWAFHMRLYCTQDAGGCVPGAWQECELHSRNEARVFSRRQSGLRLSCPVLPSNKVPRLDWGALSEIFFWISDFFHRS